MLGALQLAANDEAQCVPPPLHPNWIMRSLLTGP